jgi:hypothetical protein
MAGKCCQQARREALALAVSDKTKELIEEALKAIDSIEQ